MFAAMDFPWLIAGFLLRDLVHECFRLRAWSVRAPEVQAWRVKRCVRCPREEVRKISLLRGSDGMGDPGLKGGGIRPFRYYRDGIWGTFYLQQFRG